MSETSKEHNLKSEVKMVLTGTITRADGTIEELGVLDSQDVEPIIDPISGAIIGVQPIPKKKGIIEAVKNFFAQKDE
jgi:hypothetical protein